MLISESLLGGRMATLCNLTSTNTELMKTDIIHGKVKQQVKDWG